MITCAQAGMLHGGQEGGLTWTVFGVAQNNLHLILAEAVYVAWPKIGSFSHLDRSLGLDCTYVIRWISFNYYRASNHGSSVVIVAMTTTVRITLMIRLQYEVRSAKFHNGIIFKELIVNFFYVFHIKSIKILNN